MARAWYPKPLQLHHIRRQTRDLSTTLSVAFFAGKRIFCNRSPSRYSAIVGAGSISLAHE